MKKQLKINILKSTIRHKYRAGEGGIGDALVLDRREWAHDVTSSKVTWGSKFTARKLVSSLRTISGWARLKLQASSTPATQRS